MSNAQQTSSRFTALLGLCAALLACDHPESRAADAEPTDGDPPHIDTDADAPGEDGGLDEDADTPDAQEPFTSFPVLYPWLPEGVFLSKEPPAHADVRLETSELLPQRIETDTHPPCMVLADRSLWCHAAYDALPPPNFGIARVAGAGGGVNHGLCVLYDDHTLRCSHAGAPLTNDFVDVHLQGQSVCGLHRDGRIECLAQPDTANAPSGWLAGPYTQIAGGPHSVCGLTLDGALECAWRGPSAPDTRSLGAGYLALAAAEGLVCGAAEDQIRCLHFVADEWQQEGVTLEGPVTDLSAGKDRVCWLDGEGRFACKSFTGARGELYATEPRFADIDLSENGASACGISLQGEALCWRDSRDPERVHELVAAAEPTCERDEECPSADCAEARCVDRRCVTRPAAEGSPCSRGVCKSDSCQPVPRTEFSWREGSCLHWLQPFTGVFPDALAVAGDLTSETGEYTDGSWKRFESTSKPESTEFLRGDGWSAKLERWINGWRLLHRRDGEAWRDVTDRRFILDGQLAAAGPDLFMFPRAVWLPTLGELKQWASGPLLRFDGERWEEVVPLPRFDPWQPAPSLPGVYDPEAPFPATRAFAATPGRWWIVDTDYQLLTSEDGVTWTHVPIDDGGNVQPLGSDGAQLITNGTGPVFFQTWSGRVYRTAGAGIEALAPAPADWQRHLSSPRLVDARGERLVVSFIGGNPQERGEYDVYLYDAGEWHGIAGVTDAAALDDDGTLFALDHNRLRRVRGAENEALTPATPVGSLVGPSLASLWARSDDGWLLRLDGEQWRELPNSRDLYLLGQTLDGVVLASRDNRVYREAAGAFEELSHGATPPWEAIFDIVGRSVNDLYVADSQRVFHWDGTSWSELSQLRFKDRDPARGLLLWGERGLMSSSETEVWNGDRENSYPEFGLLTSEGDAWMEVDGGHKSRSVLVQLGPSASPVTAVFRPNQGLMGRALSQQGWSDFGLPPGPEPQTLAGTDFEHLVGIRQRSFGTQLVLLDQGEWKPVTTVPDAISGSGCRAWYGGDAVGCGGSGVSICRPPELAAPP